MLETEGEHPDKLLHRATTEAIIGAAFEVHREIGYGFLERVYQRALQVELLRRGVAAETERRIQVQYKEAVVGDYVADLIVADSVAVEIKVNPQYDKHDQAQLLNEVRATDLKVGLLVNFGRNKVEYRRLVF
jgi:GxxExxY protein